MTWYSLLKFVHVLLAITAVGSNITYAAWNIRGAREPQHLAFALKGIQFLDNRVANPAYGLLLLTGLTLVAAGKGGRQGRVFCPPFPFRLPDPVPPGVLPPGGPRAAPGRGNRGRAL